jgi:putative FmdB family regulatory protein
MLDYTDGMPMIEYTCGHCGHSFKRVTLLGETPHPAPCPECKASRVEPAKEAARLFKGISSSSSLARDTN